MSEPKQISPLLDGFTLGSPMSEHDGVRCCPAIKENTEKKYIVKVITIPASQVQLDALLLAGAYKDPEDAMAYYRRVGEDIMKEAELLKTLSSLDGFLSYDGWQMEPITRHRLGYELYLISSYKRSLEKYVRKNPVTHLDAINLGLDLCSALSVCRQAGSLYVDLKPSNIFLSDKKDYRIGDLGFVDLNALRYTTLPEKYHSKYTPPELFDPMAQLNLTVDTYAVGMILYQLYNDGQLPFKKRSAEQVLPSPINADYELAEIIMRAIDPDPDNRWTDPADMGKALASYMQRNSVNDVPITPHTPLDRAVNGPNMVTDDSDENAPADLPIDPEKPFSEECNDIPEETSATSVLDDDADTGVTAKEPDSPISEAEDETEPNEQDADSLLPHEMSEELSSIMAKADDLISHETPDGVVVPDIPELPDPFAFASEDSDEIDDSDVPLDPVMDDPDESEPVKEVKRKFFSQNGKKFLKKVLSALALILTFVVVCMAAFVFYKHFYLQEINGIHIEGDKSSLKVSVDSDIDPERLLVICSDHYGNVKSRSLIDGAAVFENLQPNTMYTIEIDMEGFHKLIGQTTDVFTTDATTNIVSFNAVTGKDDGTVMLNFTVDGEEPDFWKLRYQADGEEEQVETFTGHSVSISGLSVGKVYTFTLDTGNSLSLSGAQTLKFLASRLIFAEELTVTSSGNSDMTVHWKAPGDIVVENWDVRCYNDAGYDEQLTVSDTSVYLSGIDPRSGYTIEVTAAGMTQPVRTSITANPISIQELHVDDSAINKLTVSWDYTGPDPEGGWLLIYSMDGGSTQSVVKCKAASAEITPKIPDAKYLFTIQAVDGTSVFNNVHSYVCPGAALFEAHSLSAENVEMLLVETPDDSFWHFGKLDDDAVTDQFKAGTRISAVLHCSTDFYLPGAQQIDILYVVRDAYGNVLPDLIAQETGYWKDIWYDGDYHYAELDIPHVPEKAGNYTLDIFFNGFAMASSAFSITE